MRSTLLLSTFGCALFNAIHAFEFTGPDSSEKLNLTQPINITWNATSGSMSEPKARALDLWFIALVNDDRQGRELASNLTLSSGSYKWNPETIVQIFQDDDVSVSPDAVHYFEARLIDNAGSELATIETEKYALDGFDFIKNSGGKGLQPGFSVTVAMAVMVGVVANSIM
ncbi:hypothetical protein FSPOR_2840 [Fusarium sporotrichioides]|uniref:Uncharacterized protein n=1 Tax=Fusarium sporotrichioides TaxID=5514 RepID=A0A395SID5_FUSSP|nr:hypothetical protein FSPOR_2840 [Fusarium sporotrichioides]